MAEFSSDDPLAMTPEEQDYFRRAADAIGAGPRSFIENTICQYFEDRGIEMPDESDEPGDDEVMYAYLMNDSRYGDKIRELLEESEVAILAVAKLFRTSDEILEVRRAIEREAGRLLIERNKIRYGDVTPEDFK
jgi:hypothetical protein